VPVEDEEEEEEEEEEVEDEWKIKKKAYPHSFLTYMEVSGQPHDLAAIPPRVKAFCTADI
jgi:hypothetical protein